MTVTFTVPGLPEHFEGDPADRVIATTPPSPNMANAVAAAIFRLLGLANAPYGEIAAERVADLAKAIARVRNTCGALDTEVRVAEVIPGGMNVVADAGVVRLQRGPTVFECGIDEARLQRNLAALHVLCVAAQRTGQPITWS